MEALFLRWSMTLSENRYPPRISVLGMLFGIML